MQERRLKERMATAMSGALSGGLVSICVQPLDVIRTRMQGDGAKGQIRCETLSALTGAWPTIQRIYGENGAVGFWRGTGPTVLRMTVGVGLHFTCLEVLKTLLHATQKNKSDWLKDATIGGLSRGAVTIILCPVTVIKTRMEYVDPSYTSTLHAALTIAKKEGMRGLFKGVVPTFAANAPFSALHYMVYRKMQSIMHREGDVTTTFGNFVCSGVAAATATLITQPADVVRTRIQLGMGTAGALSSIATLRQVLVTQGVLGITMGVAPRMMKRILQTALIWTLYEEIAPRMRRSME